MKKTKPTAEDKKEASLANRAFNFLLALGKRKGALISLEEIKKQPPTLFDQLNEPQ